MLNFNENAHFAHFLLQIQYTFSNALYAAKFKTSEHAFEKRLLMVYYISVKFTHRNMHHKAVLFLNKECTCTMSFNALLSHH